MYCTTLGLFKPISFRFRNCEILTPLCRQFCQKKQKCVHLYHCSWPTCLDLIKIAKKNVKNWIGLWYRQFLIDITHDFYLKDVYINPVWHETGDFPPVEFVRSDFVSWFFFKNFQTFLEVKIEINLVIFIPCPAHWVLQKLPLRVKVEHFSCFVISCQTGLTVFWNRPVHNSLLLSYRLHDFFM